MLITDRKYDKTDNDGCVVMVHSFIYCEQSPHKKLGTNMDSYNCCGILLVYREIIIYFMITCGVGIVYGEQL